MATETTRKLLEQLRLKRQDIHDELANVQMSLSRPITPVMQNECLTILMYSMTALRNMDEQFNEVITQIKMQDKELGELANAVMTIRFGSTVGTQDVDVPAPYNKFTSDIMERR